LFNNLLLNTPLKSLKYLLSIRLKKLSIFFTEKHGKNLRLRQNIVLPKSNFGFFHKLASDDYENYSDSENSAVQKFLMANKNNFFHFFVSITNFF